MKSFSSLILLMLLSICGYAQASDFYYTFNNEKIFLTKISGKYLVEFPGGLEPNAGYPGTKLTASTYIVLDTSNLNSYSSNHFVTPAYLVGTTSEVYYTRDVVLKFKAGTSTEAKESALAANGLSFVKSTVSYDMYKAAGNALQVSQAVYESGLVEFCTPDLLSKVIATSHIPNDQYFVKQWYLHNTGQGTNDGKSTTPNADIDAPEAWDITTGNANIIIAVIDNGVTSNHPDLPNSRQIHLAGSNFAYQYDGSNNPDAPYPTSSTTAMNNHGTSCAGIIAASQDNGSEGISGIAPLCQILPIKIPLGGNITVPGSVYADAINFGAAHASILSNSWGIDNSSHNFFPVVVTAIQNAVDNGKTVVFGAGNTAGRKLSTFNGYVIFPANADIDEMITVGSSDRNNHIADYSPNGQELEIVAPSQTAIWCVDTTEAGNVWTLDIPGNEGMNPYKYIPGVTCDRVPGGDGETLPANSFSVGAYTGRFGGTSASAPQVAGVAALMKSVNSCLSNYQIKDLLQISADKIDTCNYYWNPDKPGHSWGMGYGKLNAYKAVKAAQAAYSSTLDLFTKDNATDIGTIGTNGTGGGDKSPDIWVRNQDDGLTNQASENPEFQNSTPCYVYVRVRNKSCVASTGTEKLSLYWSKAAGWSSWPQNWDGSQPTTGNVVGSKILTQIIPPGGSTIVKFVWTMLDPHVNNTWNSCLMSRIENVAVDPITVHAGRLDQDVNHNNNVALRNVTVTDIYPGKPKPYGGVVLLGNPLGAETSYNFQFEVPHFEHPKTPLVVKEAEVRLSFDEQGWNILESANQLNQEGIKIVGERQIIITEPSVGLNNLVFPPDTRVPVEVTFNFLTDENTPSTDYEYVMRQSFSSMPDTVLGCENFVVHKQPRVPFNANAGNDKTINRNESVTISAQQISEMAVYNWYNEDGDLIYTGKDLTVSPDITKKYRLEVISSADGFKDYDEVQVNVKKFSITNITPNPASTQINITYDAATASSAYFILVPAFGNTSSNYIAMPSSTQKTINLSGFQPGVYTLVLVCNGQVADAKALQIN